MLKVAVGCFKPALPVSLVDSVSRAVVRPRWRGGAIRNAGRTPQPHVFCWERNMGVKNYLIEGLSGTGKSSVCDELRRRGYHSIHGDRDLAYQGDPETGEPLDGFAHEHHIWDVDKVRALVADQSHAASFFCGGSRNFDRFIDLFAGVFVLEVDLPTLTRRLALRPEDEWGGRASEREFVERLHATREDIPKNAIAIDATAPIARVVDAILENAN